MRQPGQANAAYKVCPSCKQAAILSMDVCQRCGHQFNSPPPQSFPVDPFIPSHSTPSVLQTTNWLLTGVLVMLVVIASFIYLSDRHTHGDNNSFFMASH